MKKNEAKLGKVSNANEQYKVSVSCKTESNNNRLKRGKTRRQKKRTNKQISMEEEENVRREERGKEPKAGRGKVEREKRYKRT